MTLESWWLDALITDGREPLYRPFGQLIEGFCESQGDNYNDQRLSERGENKLESLIGKTLL